MDHSPGGSPNDGKKKGPEIEKSAWSYLNISVQYAVTVGACAWAGTWIDQRYKCEPWGVICCTLFGITVATYLLLKEVT